MGHKKNIKKKNSNKAEALMSHFSAFLSGDRTRDKWIFRQLHRVEEEEGGIRKLGARGAALPQQQFGSFLVFL